MECPNCVDGISETNDGGIKRRFECDWCGGTGTLSDDTEEQQQAVRMYPTHHPVTALANYRAGREVWDSNGDPW